jgi:hypothetical protein
MDIDYATTPELGGDKVDTLAQVLQCRGMIIHGGQVEVTIKSQASRGIVELDAHIDHGTDAPFLHPGEAMTPMLATYVELRHNLADTADGGTQQDAHCVVRRPPGGSPQSLMGEALP